MKTIICALICTLSISGPVRAEVPRIPEVDVLEVQAIVDNYYDCFQKEEKCAKRVLFVHGHTFDDIRLQAEMGLAYVITATVGNKKHMLLFDFGLSPSVYQNNLQRLNVDASKAEALLLSHAHQDHYGGCRWLLQHRRHRSMSAERTHSLTASPSLLRIRSTWIRLIALRWKRGAS